MYECNTEALSVIKEEERHGTSQVSRTSSVRHPVTVSNVFLQLCDCPPISNVLFYVRHKTPLLSPLLGDLSKCWSLVCASLAIYTKQILSLSWRVRINSVACVRGGSERGLGGLSTSRPLIGRRVNAKRALSLVDKNNR